MLKKLIAIFFLTVYAATSMGASVYTHYCMDSRVGTSLWHAEDDKCGKCGMTEEQGKGCCKDEQQLIKLNADHNLSSTAALPDFFTAPAIITKTITFPEVLFISLAAHFPASHAPPDIGPGLNIMHCVFKI